MDLLFFYHKEFIYANNKQILVPRYSVISPIMSQDLEKQVDKVHEEFIILKKEDQISKIPIFILFIILLLSSLTVYVLQPISLTTKTDFVTLSEKDAQGICFFLKPLVTEEENDIIYNALISKEDALKLQKTITIPRLVDAGELLIDALNCSNYALSTKLIAAGVDVNYSQNDPDALFVNTPLKEAIFSEDLFLIDILVKKGAIVNYDELRTDCNFIFTNNIDIYSYFLTFKK